MPSPGSDGAIPLAGKLRIALRIAALIGTLLVCLPAYYLRAPFGANNPVPRFFLRQVARICGLRVKHAGAVSALPAVLLANHLSWLDIPALAGATGTAFVAHDGLAAIGPLRWLCEMNDTVFIARHERTSIAEQVAQVREAIEDCGLLTIFPEGTTNDGTRLLPFKSSLLSALDSADRAMAVQPVWLDYGDATEAIAWFGDEPGLKNAMRVLARREPIELTVNLLPALQGEARRDRKAMARAAQDAVTRAMANADQRVAL